MLAVADSGGGCVLAIDSQREVFGERHGVSHPTTEHFDERHADPLRTQISQPDLDPTERATVGGCLVPQAEPGGADAPSFALVESVDGQADETRTETLDVGGEITVGGLPDACHTVAVRHRDDGRRETGQGPEREAVWGPPSGR